MLRKVPLERDPLIETKLTSVHAAATFHFNNLAEENESTTNTISKIESLDPETFFIKPLP